jgi:Flp pilus assembly protein TadD
MRIPDRGRTGGRASHAIVALAARMRSILLLLAFLLAACGGHEGASLGSGLPGINVARAALSAGSPDLALRVTNGILEKDPSNLSALLIQGDALTMLTRPDEAASSYSKAIAVDPASTDALLGLGRLRLQTDPTEAQRLFLSVLAREPRNLIALNDLGIAYDLQGSHASAQDAYRRALGVNSTMRSTEVNLALSLALSGQAKQAVELLRPLAADPAASRRLRHDLAAALAMAGDKEAATHVLSADLTSDQIERALVAYEKLGS